MNYVMEKGKRKGKERNKDLINYDISMTQG